MSIVTFPSPEIEFIIGPQVKSGTATNPGAQWFDQNAIDRGLSLCAAFPDVAHTPGNVLISGTVSVTNGSKIVIGTGTRFLTEAKDYAIIANGSAGRIVKIVASVESDTSLALTLPWQGATLSGQSMSSPTSTETDDYSGYQNYYDFALTQYMNYYRTNDLRLQACARKVADSWWSQPSIDYGRNLASRHDGIFAPRSASLSGLMLRALDGRPEMWVWITDYVDYHFRNWVEVPTGWAEKDPATAPLYFGVRDGGFMLLYAANLAAVHPDPSVRADFKSRVLRCAVNYYATLQKPDGSYRWNDDGFPFSGIEQPFMVGILNEGMIAVHRLTGNERVKAAIIKSAEHEFLHSYNPNGWRSMYYFVHGTIGNPPVPCETGCGNASNPFPPVDRSLVDEARQLNGTVIHVFGYAYAITGNEEHVRRGDEVFDATFSGADGHRGLANARGKEYNECYRSAGKYLGWRAGATTPAPPPDPDPPVPEPPKPEPPIPPPPDGPVPTEPSPDGTKATTIMDANRNVWTLGSAGETLKNGIRAGGGSGSIYKLWASNIYVLGTGNSGWWQWVFDSSWRSVGMDEPGGTAPPPPDPVPEPPAPEPPKPTCSISAPASISIRRNSTGSIAVTLQDLSSPVEVKVIGSDGQVTVSPLSWQAGPTSTVKQFQVKVKRQSRTITFQSPCGTVEVRINVT